MFQPDGSLEEIDPEIFGIIKQEKARQVCVSAAGTRSVWLVHGLLCAIM